MALPDILKKINAEAEAEISLVEADKNNQLAEVLSNHQKFVSTQTDAAKTDRERRAQKIAERILAKARHESSFIEASAINQQVELVMKQIEADLLNLSDADYEDFLQKRFEPLKAIDNLRFEVATERAKNTADFLKKQGVNEAVISTRPGLGGGFLAMTDSTEYDASFKQVLSDIRIEKTSFISNRLTA